MADIEQDILDAYYTSLGTQQAGTLSWMHFFAFPGEVDIQDFEGLVPLVLVWAEGATLVDSCMCGPTLRQDTMKYRIKMAAIEAVYDTSYGTHSPNVPDRRIMSSRRNDLDVLYGRETFDLSDAATLEDYRYGIPTFPGYQTNGQTWIHAVELTIVHDYIRQLTLS